MSKPDIVGFTLQKNKKKKKGKKRRRRRRERGREGRERERERGELEPRKMLTFGSPQLSPPVKIGGVRFRGLLLSLCVCTAKKRRWKGKKKCH